MILRLHAVLTGRSLDDDNNKIHHHIIHSRSCQNKKSIPKYCPACFVSPTVRVVDRDEFYRVILEEGAQMTYYYYGIEKGACPHPPPLAAHPCFRPFLHGLRVSSSRRFFFECVCWLL
jgi:hypothetical protein